VSQLYTSVTRHVAKHNLRKAGRICLVVRQRNFEKVKLRIKICV